MIEGGVAESGNGSGMLSEGGVPGESATMETGRTADIYTISTSGQISTNESREGQTNIQMEDLSKPPPSYDSLFQ